MTAPRPVLAVMFPAEYGAVITLLKDTAVTGLATGGIGLTVAFFQAADDYACLARLGAGIAVYIAALLGGWWAAGIAGLAVGGALGAVAALALLGWRLIACRGRAVLAGVSLLEPALATGLLILLRPSTLLWLTAAALIGLRAGLRFLRPAAEPRSARGHPAGKHRRTGTRDGGASADGLSAHRRHGAAGTGAGPRALVTAGRESPAEVDRVLSASGGPALHAREKNKW
jgi:hypothetical protein